MRFLFSYLQVAASQPPNMASRTRPETFLAPSRSPPTKVYSISTTNENKEVSVFESHEVSGKSSTDGTASAGTVGNLSLDALSEVKRALQKVLAEKQKQIPVVIYQHLQSFAFYFYFFFHISCAYCFSFIFLLIMQLL